ncbi:hypothetical protein LINPERHAP1_LOCUS23083 [Linum perenne]
MPICYNLRQSSGQVAANGHLYWIGSKRWMRDFVLQFDFINDSFRTIEWSDDHHCPDSQRISNRSKSSMNNLVMWLALRKVTGSGIEWSSTPASVYDLIIIVNIKCWIAQASE